MRFPINATYIATVRTYGKTILKVLLWVLVSLVGLVVMVFIALQLKPVQNYIADKAVNMLRDKTGAVVRLGSIDIDFPTTLDIEELYVEDQETDTLFYAQRLRARLDMFGLLRNKVNIGRFEGENITVNLKRTLPDSSFNFKFILDGLANDTKESAKEKKGEDTTTGGWDIALGDIDLGNVRFSLRDEVGGANMEYNVGSLAVDMREVNLTDMEFRGNKVALSNSSASVEIYKVTPPEESDETNPISLRLDELSLDNIYFVYTDRVLNQRLVADVGKSVLSGSRLSTSEEVFKAGSYYLGNSRLEYLTGKYQTADSILKGATEAIVEEDAPQSEQAWVVDLGELILDNDSFKMINYGSPEVQGFDMNHLVLGDITSRIRDIHYGPDSTLAFVERLSLKDDKGFVIQEFSTGFSMSKHRAIMDQLVLRTNHSHIERYIQVRFNDVAQIGENIGELGLQAVIEDSYVGAADLIYFSPELAQQEPFAGNRNMRVHLAGNVEGQVNDLRINNLRVNALQSMAATLSGTVKGLPDMDKSYFNIDLKRLTFAESDLYALLPDTAVPSNINLPSRTIVRGTFKGTINDFNAHANVNTTIGDIVANLTMKPGAQKDQRAYTAVADITELDLGQLLNDTAMLGTVTTEVAIRGEGLSLEEMDAQVKLVLQEATINKYTYEHLVVNGHIKNQAFAGVAEMKDDALALIYSGTVSFDTANPYYDFKMEVTGADLQQLNLAEKNIRLRGLLDVNVKGSTLNDINGDIAVKDVLILKGDEEYPIQSLLFASIQEKERTEITVKSDFFSGFFKGNINIGDFPQAFKRHMDRYFYVPMDSGKPQKPEEQLAPQRFSFELQMHKPEILTEIILPDLEEFNPGTIKGNYNSQEKNLVMEIRIPDLTYSGIVVDTLVTEINSNPNRLNYTVRVKQFAIGDFTVQNAAITGYAANDSLNVDLSVEDSMGQRKFLLSGVVGREEDDYRMTIKPDGAIMNYERWAVANDAYLKVGKNGLFAHNFLMRNSDRFIKLNSEGVEGERAPVLLSFNKFPLAAISSLVEAEEPLIRGSVNGNVTFQNDTNKIAFIAKAEINDFSYQGDTLGDIALDVRERSRGQYYVESRIRGSGNAIYANGYYESKGEEQSYEFDIDIDRLYLASIQGFVDRQVTDLRGMLTGDLELKGNTKNPDITGELRLQDAQMNIRYLNSLYRVDDERIVFMKEGIRFDRFTILDSANNIAVLDGNVRTKYFEEFRFDLSLDANNFKVLNTTETDEQVYYGRGIVTTDLSITGDSKRPVIRGSVNINEHSDLYVEMPKNDVQQRSREGIVQFIDQDSSLNDILYQEDADTVEIALEGVTMDLNIQVDRGAVMSIIIDPVAGDRLRVQGYAALSFSMDADGEMALTGRYELTNGQYLFTFANLIKREFEIQKGSVITWFGDPLDARMDITAVYNVKAAPLALVENQVTGLTEPERNRYLQKIPFNVVLNIQGELQSPDINLGIEMPPTDNLDRTGVVNARLNQMQADESEMNKQVFALVVLGRFLPDDPLQSAGPGPTVSSVVAGSVSDVLSEQLNRLAGEYVKNTEITLDVETYDDYTTGEAINRTDLNVGLSRQFLDERLEVSVGSDINLRGNVPGDDNVSNIVGNIQVEYKLTRDGRLRAIVFRQEEYEGIITQDIIETGAGLIFVREYNKVKELFKKPKDIEIEDAE